MSEPQLYWVYLPEWWNSTRRMRDDAAKKLPKESTMNERETTISDEARKLNGLMLEVWACTKPHPEVSPEMLRKLLGRCLPFIRAAARQESLLTDEAIYAVADQHGTRYRTSDEEAMSFDKHAVLEFARAVAAHGR